MRKTGVRTLPAPSSMISSYSALPRAWAAALDLAEALLWVHHRAGVGGVDGLQDEYAGRCRRRRPPGTLGTLNAMDRKSPDSAPVAVIVSPARNCASVPAIILRTITGPRPR